LLEGCHVWWTWMAPKLDGKALQKVGQASAELDRRHSVNIEFPIRAYKKLSQIVVIVHVSKDHLGVHIMPKAGDEMFKVPSVRHVGRSWAEV
jgi:hypothetical protein